MTRFAQAYQAPYRKAGFAGMTWGVEPHLPIEGLTRAICSPATRTTSVLAWQPRPITSGPASESRRPAKLNRRRRCLPLVLPVWTTRRPENRTASPRR